MRNSFLIYLAEASFCVAVFSLTYRLLLARLTHFAWNRAYLVGTLAASLLLPLLLLPGSAGWLTMPAAAIAGPGPLFHWKWQAASTAAAPVTATTEAVSLALWLPLLALGIYLLGVSFRLAGLLRDLSWVRQLVRDNPRTWEDGYWLVQVRQALPAFSFARFVFLSPAHDQLSAPDRRLVLQHEYEHVRQYHTWDLLLAEAVGVLLWFHPLVKYLRHQLKDVHEYLADAAMARATNPQQYGRLLVQLAAQQPPVALVHALSSKQIFARIQTLTQPPSSPMKKLRFLLVLPVVAAAWLATSAFNMPAVTGSELALAQSGKPGPKASGVPIGRITWQGNTVVSAAKLSQALGLKAGDTYDSAAVAQRLNMAANGRDISSLYMDQGYMFFSIEPKAQRQPNGTVNLAFALSEGPQVRIRNVVFVGNKKVPTATLASLVPVQAGQLFSRTKLMQAQRNLAKSGHFDPAKVGINPKPVMTGTGLPSQADIEFVVVEKN